MPLLQSREKSSVTLSQKSQSVLCKAFLRIDTSRPFPVNKYSPNICTCKCNVSRLYRNANLSPYRNEKNEEAHTFAPSTEFISEHLRLFSLVLFLPHPEGNLLPFADDGLLSFSQSPIALAPVFPSSPLVTWESIGECHFEGCLNCKSASRWEGSDGHLQRNCARTYRCIPLFGILAAHKHGVTQPEWTNNDSLFIFMGCNIQSGLQ